MSASGPGAEQLPTAAVEPPRFGRATTVVGIAMMAMNALAYGFTLLAAHRLGPADFGGVGALLGVLIVANVGSLALQATAARRLATAPAAERPRVRAAALRTGRQLSLAIGAGLLVAVPLLDVVLRLDDWVATAMIAPACAALTMMGAYAGITQGERRWSPLAAIYVAMGFGRVLAGGLALAVETSIRSAMIGVAVGSLLPLAVGRWLCRSRQNGDVVGTAPPPVPAPQLTGGDTAALRELWRNGHTLLAFFAFTNVDLLLARNLFGSHDAGIYASGAIVTKTCLFLPTFVLVIAFPTMATDRRGRAWLRPLLFVAALGGCAVVGALLLPELAQSFAGGSDYAGLGHVSWVFALEGTLFAVLQILVYETIAGQSHSATLLWAGVATAVGVAALAAHSVASLAIVLVGTAVVAGLLLAALALRRRQPPSASSALQQGLAAP